MRPHSLTWLGLLVLSSCGFHPLYGSSTSQSAGLQAVYVDVIPNRDGQLLRQALQARLEGDTSDAAKRFVLGVSYSEAPQALSVQADNSTTRVRDVGTATWNLRPLDKGAAQLAGGTVRSLDGYNVIDEQFFYADLSAEAAQRRLAEALADQIVSGVARYLDKQTSPSVH